MILDSFKPFTLTFQIQYAEAYLLWDRAGIIAARVCKIWPGLNLKEGTPQQQVLAGENVTIQTGLKTSIIIIGGEKVFEQKYLSQIKETFEVWREMLELVDLTRVSTRIIFAKKHSNLKQANAELFALNLARWPESKVFDQPLDSDKNGLDISFRFEDADAFSVLRVRAEQVKAQVELDPQYFEESKITKEQHRLMIDFDRGLLGVTSATKFRVDEWLKGFQHLMRRDIEKILKA